jgi:hypothetical protein
MINIDKMLKENDFMLIGAYENANIKKGELHELIKMLREAEKDAARYRWLRDVGQHKYYVDDILGCILHGADGSVDYHMNRNDDE